MRGSHLSTLLTPPNFVRAVALLAHGLPFAPSHLQPALQTRLDGLRVSADSQSSRAALRQRNWTDGLPAELLVLVGEQAVLQDPDAVVRLAGVCVRWRDVAFSSPTLWTRLRLGPKRPKAKLARFVDASNGRLGVVVVSAAAGDVAAAIAPHLSGLASLNLAVPASTDLKGVLDTLRHALSPSLLRHLLLKVPSTALLNQSVLWEDILDLAAAPTAGGHDGRALETFSLTNVIVRRAALIESDIGRSVHPGVLPQLRRLVLARTTFVETQSGSWGLHDLTSSMPRLEELSITDETCGLRAVGVVPAPTAAQAPSPEPATFRLPCLKILNYCQSTVVGLEDQRWDIPNLERLDLSRPLLATAQSALFASILFGPARLALQSNLTHLNLARTLLDEPLLVDSLRRLPALVDLQLAMCNVSNALLEALTLAPADEGTAGPADTCPKLEILGLAHSDAITGGPLVRLVASRMAVAAPSPAPSPTSSPAGRVALRALNIDTCPAVEDKALEWLRPRLESFSCKVPRAPKAVGFAEKGRRGF